MTEQRDDVSEVEQEVGAFFSEVRDEERAPVDLWERVGARLGASGASEGARGESARGGGGVRRWVWVAGIAAVLVVGAVLVALSRGDGSPAVSAEEVLERAVAASVSPESVGIRTLVVEQEFEAYYLAGWGGGEPSLEFQVRSWYEAPDRQRVEGAGVIRAFDGEEETGSWVGVWDGDEVWRYDSVEGEVTVYRQDPEGDVFLQGRLMGSSLLDLSDVVAASCRVPEITDDGEAGGRPAYVLELSRPRCGLVFPGRDGKQVIWVDRETGFVLRSESYAVDGTLSSVSRVTEIEIDGVIADERFEFVPPAGTAVDDRRDGLVYMQGAQRMEQPAPISLDEARVEATFPLEVPAEIPAGFELESVQQYWGGEQARELRSHADWVLLRYVDEEGNWFAITQGYGGLLPALVEIVPAEAEQGRVEVGGVEVRWVDGDPTSQWEPGSMLMLSWRAGRDGTALEVLPGGEIRRGSPRSVALASNVLDLAELVAVAESLE